MKTMLHRSILPALFLSGAVVGSALTGTAFGMAQPHMQSALDALNTARVQLQAALADKGGHRQRALGYVNAAISEVKAGINYSNVH